jgi:hypothetical protein
MFNKMKEFAAKPIVQRVASELAIAVTIVIVTTIVRYEVNRLLDAVNEPKPEFAEIAEPLDDSIE